MGHRSAKTIGVLGRSLDELRHDRKHYEHPKSEQEGGQIGGPDLGDAHHLHIDQRWHGARFAADPQREQDNGPEEQTNHPGIAPANDRTL